MQPSHEHSHPHDAPDQPRMSTVYVPIKIHHHQLPWSSSTTWPKMLSWCDKSFLSFSPPLLHLHSHPHPRPHPHWRPRPRAAQVKKAALPRKTHRCFRERQSSRARSSSSSSVIKDNLSQPEISSLLLLRLLLLLLHLYETLSSPAKVHP
jgi:hypothetical protein